MELGHRDDAIGVRCRAPGLIATRPGSGTSQWAEVIVKIPLSSSSCRTASLAPGPKIASGASSGVAIVIDSSMFMS